MRRTTSIIVVLLALCSQVVTAQEPQEDIMSDYKIAGCRYWFDNSTEATQTAYKSGKITFDVAQLEEGFHTLHYQIVDDKGHVSPARTAPFFRLQTTDEKFKDYTIRTVRYWFDKDYTPREVAYTSGTSIIDVSQLEEGFHTLHYQVIDSKGETSPARTSSFYRLQPIDEQFKDYTIKAVHYWFDKDYTPREVVYTSGTSIIDVSQLEEGFHTLHYQVIDSKGEASPTRTASFFRLQPVEETFKDYAVKTLRYWFDGDVTTMRTETFASGVQTKDLSSLPEGAHTITWQVMTDDGQVSPTYTVTIDRWLYDIYISRFAEYDDSVVTGDPLFAIRPDLKLHFLPDETNVRGHLTVDEGTTLSLGKFVQTANWGSKSDGNKYTKAGKEYYHPTTLLNKGFVRADSVQVKQYFYRDRWHFISFPFNANVSNVEVSDGTYYALRAYDGEARAAGEMTETWTNLRRGAQIEAGRGYIVQLTKEESDKTSWMTFKAVNDTKKNNIFTTDDVSITMAEHLAEFAHNRSWNLVGNPYPCFYDTRLIGQDGNIIVWNGNGYSAYSLTDDNYILMPFEAFFIQKPVSVEKLTFHKEGRQHTHEVLPRSEARCSIGANRRIMNFRLSDGMDSDCSRVVINEQASIGYETDKDAPKFMEARPQMPQLFSIGSGVRYAINERPAGDGQIIFSIYAPTDCDYHFSIDGDENNMTVFDSETGTVWSLADGDYVFAATEGMHAARLIVSLTGNATAISQVYAFADGEMQEADGQLQLQFAHAKHIKVFGLDGKMFYNNVATNANIHLCSGIYIVEIDGERNKIIVK